MAYVTFFFTHVKDGFCFAKIFNSEISRKDTSSVVLVGKLIGEVAVSLIGAGAANINVAKYICVVGAKWEDIIMVDSKGILNVDGVEVKGDRKKWAICRKTNKGGRSGDIKAAMRDIDVGIAFSTPGSGIKKRDSGRRENIQDRISFYSGNSIIYYSKVGT
jgi:hypothetical protein